MEYDVLIVGGGPAGKCPQSLSNSLFQVCRVQSDSVSSVKSMIKTYQFAWLRKDLISELTFCLEMSSSHVLLTNSSLIGRRRMRR